MRQTLPERTFRETASASRNDPSARSSPCTAHARYPRSPRTERLRRDRPAAKRTEFLRTTARQACGLMPQTDKNGRIFGKNRTKSLSLSENQGYPIYGDTRNDPQTRSRRSGGFRRVRSTAIQRRRRTVVRHAALCALVARQGHTPDPRAALGTAERPVAGRGRRAQGLPGGPAGGDDPHHVAHPRRRDRRGRHPTRQTLGQCALAVAQGRAAGRLHPGPHDEHRHDERPVRPGDAHLRHDGHALRRRDVAERPRVAPRNDAQRLFRHHPQEDGEPDRRERLGGRHGRRRPARAHHPHAPLRRSPGHGVPDPGRHPRLYAHGPHGQTREQRPARRQDHAAAARRARTLRHRAERGAARPARAVRRGRRRGGAAPGDRGEGGRHRRGRTGHARLPRTRRGHARRIRPLGGASVADRPVRLRRRARPAPCGGAAPRMRPARRTGRTPPAGTDRQRTHANTNKKTVWNRRKTTRCPSS